MSRPGGAMALDSKLELIASRFVEGVDELALRIIERLREVRDLEGFEAPAVWEATREVTSGSRLAQAAHLTNGRQIPMTCPPPDAEAARMAARAGLSPMTVLQLYRVGHDESWKAWLEAVDDVEIEEEEEARRRCRHEISEFVVHYDYVLATLVGEVFDEERRRASGDGRDRLALIRGLLDGSTHELDGLNYSVDQEHLGLIVWGSRVDETLDALHRELSGQCLAVEIERDVTMAWLGGFEDRTASQPQRVLARFKPPPATQVAIGNPASGLDGFRRSHRQAGEAYLVAARGSDPLTLFADVELQAWALRDETRAREFVTNRLAGLGAGDEPSDKLIETLLAYFATGHNTSSTAARLQVDPRTVARRLEIMEEQLGRPVNECRPELELALRLKSLLT